MEISVEIFMELSTVSVPIQYHLTDPSSLRKSVLELVIGDVYLYPIICNSEGVGILKLFTLIINPDYRLHPFKALQLVF